MTSARSRRSTKPADAFPNGAWRDWRQHVLTVDIEAVHAAVIAERLERFIETARLDGESIRQIGVRTGISHTSLSTMARCLTYAMEGIVARLQDVYAIDLNPAAEVRAVKKDAEHRRYVELSERFADLEARHERLLTRCAQLEARLADTAQQRPHPPPDLDRLANRQVVPTG